MVTKYEFGFGDGEMSRRRRKRREEQKRQREKASAQRPEAERRPYDSDYHGFRGAGRRGKYDREFQVERPGGARRGPAPGGSEESP